MTIGFSGELKTDRREECYDISKLQTIYVKTSEHFIKFLSALIVHLGTLEKDQKIFNSSNWIAPPQSLSRFQVTDGKLSETHFCFLDHSREPPAKTVSALFSI